MAPMTTPEAPLPPGTGAGQIKQMFVWFRRVRVVRARLERAFLSPHQLPVRSGTHTSSLAERGDDSRWSARIAMGQQFSFGGGWK
jgi:hypothetical protein